MIEDQGVREAVGGAPSYKRERGKQRDTERERARGCERKKAKKKKKKNKRKWRRRGRRGEREREIGVADPWPHLVLVPTRTHEPVRLRARGGSACTFPCLC